MGKNKLKRQRQATSEEKNEEEAEEMDSTNKTATPKSSRDPESTVRTSKPTYGTSSDSMLRNILEKVSVLDEINIKIDAISERMSKIETKFERMDTRIQDLENATEYMESEMGEIKEEVQNIQASKASYEYVNELRRGVVDLVNRSKQNNVILHGIPEGEEGVASENSDCVTFARNFFNTYLHMKDVEIERAHRTPARVHRAEQRSEKQPQSRPRPIHVKLLRFADRVAILKQSSKLKDVKIRGSRIGISDDVHKDTRIDHNRLMTKVKELRSQNKFAFIPNSVPRVIKYKDGPKDQPGPLKTLRLTDLDNSDGKMIY